MKRWLMTVMSCYFLCSTLWAQGDSTRNWKIKSVTLTPDGTTLAPDGTRPQMLRATVLHTLVAETVDLSAEVRLNKVEEAFISKDRLVVFGEAGRTNAVVIFDLLTKKEIDWFSCYMPRRVSEDWMVYVEFYFSMGPGEPTDVVLLYDLARSPAENRLEKKPGVNLPPGLYDGPVEVGIPIYPESNARQRSYANRVADITAALRVLGSPFLLLPSKRLVFSVSEGFDYLSSHKYLMVVDLSRGMSNIRSKAVDIPTSELRKHEGDNPRMVEITSMEAVSENAVRLYVPQSKYGVSSIVVDLPKF